LVAEREAARIARVAGAVRLSVVVLRGGAQAEERADAERDDADAAVGEGEL